MATTAEEVLGLLALAGTENELGVSMIEAGDAVTAAFLAKLTDSKGILRPANTDESKQLRTDTFKALAAAIVDHLAERQRALPKKLLSKASWFSPVTSAALVGATSILGDFSVGPAMRALADMTCRGIRFYWQQPAGAPTSRDVKVSLWRQFDATLLKQTTMTLSSTGVYTFEFAAITLAAYQNYIPSLWDTHPTSGTRVFTHSSNEEKGAGYPQGQRTDPDATLVQAASPFGPYWLYVVGGFHAGDAMPTLSNSNRYPTELILDDVDLSGGSDAAVNPQVAPNPPSGGTVQDAEARASVAALIAKLIITGTLK